MEEASSDGQQGDGGVGRAQHFQTRVHQNQMNCKVFSIFMLYVMKMTGSYEMVQ